MLMLQVSLTKNEAPIVGWHVSINVAKGKSGTGTAKRVHTRIAMTVDGNTTLSSLVEDCLLVKPSQIDLPPNCLMQV